MFDGIGVDLCDIARIERAMEKSHFMERVYTEEERAYLEKKGRGAAQSAAAMFAAKEAIAKALGTGFSVGVMPGQIGVTHAENGAPGAVLTGTAAQLLAGRRVMLSLSHEGGQAVAFAMIAAE